MARQISTRNRHLFAKKRGRRETARRRLISTTQTDSQGVAELLSLRGVPEFRSAGKAHGKLQDSQTPGGGNNGNGATVRAPADWCRMGKPRAPRLNTEAKTSALQDDWIKSGRGEEASLSPISAYITKGTT